MERKPAYNIQPLFAKRWSPRSMTGETMTDEELMPLFEAARWAPSSYNEQPWTLLYAKRDTPEWEVLFDLLVEPNKLWCKNASVLILFVSRTTYARNNKPYPTHTYDTGAAWMSMALEGSERGYVVHGMSGFDYEKARSALNIPEGHTVEAMAAIGKPAPKEALPEALQKMEEPSDRKPISEFAIPGPFPS
ncbi:MAG: nitroreductase family protein [Simkaniaceae bacterium]|nr:nitroreductase family protein [Candidatus Sacchlamyda saccharinae]